MQDSKTSWGCREGQRCFITLEVTQSWQFLMKAVISALILLHKYKRLTSLCMARIPGWWWQWRALMTRLQRAIGIKTHLPLVEVSTSRSSFSWTTVRADD